MSPEEALAISRIARAAFPAQRFDEYTVDVWADALADEDFGEIRAAIGRLVKHQTFASVGELIAEARYVRREAMRAINDRKVFAAIEAAKSEASPSSSAIDECKRAFADAITARKGEPA